VPPTGALLLVTGGVETTGVVAVVTGVVGMSTGGVELPVVPPPPELEQAVRARPMARTPAR
jgi:hypothetical protein